MRFRNTLILAVVVALLGAYVVWVEKPAMEREELETKLLDLDPAKVTGLSIETANGATKKQVRAEVASNDAERQRGLMFRASLPADTGMLFLFPRDLQGGFWMENTYLPLTIAYLDKDGVILSMKDGKPLDRTVLQPAMPYRMVLEMEQGWFERNGFAVGSIVKVPATGLPTPK